MSEFRIYHVARNTARHNYELDDRLYGTPEQKSEEDWTIKSAEKSLLYIQRVKAELNKLDTAIDDLAYLLRENGHPQEYDEKPALPSIETADSYVFHSFTVRQFGYAEKLSKMLESMSPHEIKLDIPKAKRQFNVLLAARADLQVTLVRYTAYYKQL